MTSSGLPFRKQIRWFVTGNKEIIRMVVQTRTSHYHRFKTGVPLLNAAQTPNCDKANIISQAPTISIISDRLLKKGSSDLFSLGS
jgi:hypothetical protein